MSRENYFILLDLDPEKYANDIGVIQSTLAAKKTEWSSNVNHPRDGKRYKQYLDEIPKIKLVMSDNTARQQEASEAKQMFAQRRAEDLKRFDQQVRVIAANGDLTEVDVNELAVRFKASMSEAELRARLAQLGATIKAVSAKASEPRPKLDPTVAERITARLKIVGKKDLYDFLEMPETTAAKQLRDGANDIYAKVRNNMNKDARIGAAQELAGECMTVFESETSREKYDNTRASAKLDRIRELAKIAGKQLRRIRAPAIDQLITEGKKDGLKQEEVIEAVRECGWPVEVPAQPTANSFQRCGTCGELAPLNVANCPRDGTPFKLKCPKCSTVNPSESRFCAQQGCGFPIGNMPLANRALRDAQMAQLHGNAAEAIQQVTLALTYWPGHPEALRVKMELEQAQAAERAAVEAVEQAILQRQFMRAQASLLRLCQMLPEYPRLAQCEKQVQNALAAAAECVARARKHQKENKADDAIDAFIEGLTHCVDYGDAQQGLARCPPEPPRGLQMTSTPRMIGLTWLPSPSRSQLAYRLIRKANSQPTSPDDGDIIGETTANGLADDATEAGTIYYFAVYTRRGNVFSSRASLIGPVQRLGEVEACPPVARDRCVSLNWRPPSRATAIEVWRSQGAPPQKRGEGQLLTTVTMTSCSDQGLLNDTSYGYRVVTVYQDVNSRPVYSEGITLVAVPVELPKPVTDLVVVRSDKTVRGTWTPPPAGEALIFLGDSRPAWVCGDVLPFQDVSKIGQRLPAIDHSSVQATVQPNQTAYLIPVTVSASGATAVVGKAVGVSWMDDVDIYTGKVNDGMLLATWKWPNELETALVAWRKDRFPESPEDPRATSELCLRVKYEQQGGFEKRISNVSRLYVVVYAMKKQGRDFQYSAGREFVACPSRRIRHRVLPTRAEAGEYILEVTPDASTELPELLLVIKSGRRPLFAKNGEAVLSIRAGSICTPEKPLHIPFRVASGLVDMKSRLFLAENDNAKCSWLDLD